MEKLTQFCASRPRGWWPGPCLSTQSSSYSLCSFPLGPPEYSLEGLALKLKLQYFGNLIQRANSLERTLTLGKLKAGGEGDDRGWNGWMASLTQWTWVWANSGKEWRTGKPGVRADAKSWTWLSDWTTTVKASDVTMRGGHSPICRPEMHYRERVTSPSP